MSFGVALNLAAHVKVPLAGIVTGVFEVRGVALPVLGVKVA